MRNVSKKTFLKFIAFATAVVCAVVLWWMVKPCLTVWIPTWGLNAVGKLGGVHAEELRLSGISSLEARGLRVKDYAEVDKIKIDWTWLGLLTRKIELLDVTGANISLDRMLKDDDAKGGKREGLQTPFHVKELRIRESSLTKHLFGEAYPPAALPIGSIAPELVFRDLYLGGKTTDEAANKPVEAFIESYTLYSPYDYITPLLFFGKIRVVFTWAGLQNKRLEVLDIEDPIIYICDELFWFTEDVKEANKSREGAQPEEPWTIGTFSVSGGRMELAGYKRGNVKLPFIWMIEPHENLVVGNLSEMHLKTKAVIRKRTRTYPDYGPLKLVGFEGTMEFSLPPSKRANNIVNVLKMEKIQWKSLEATDAQIWATYDAKGIYGGFYAKSYGGEFGGDFTFYFNQQQNWIASLYTAGVDVRPVTDLLSPEHFIMYGPVKSKFVVEGESREVQRMKGNVQLSNEGVMTVVAVDDLLKKLPDNWMHIKKELAREALEAFRDYDYEKGTCEFEYHPPESFAVLSLKGLQGERNFDLRWHDERNQK